MPNPTCRIKLANGESCGYVSQGENMREQIADLHRHGDGHLAELDPVGESARQANREATAERNAAKKND